MKATEQLRNEHEGILLMLEVLEELCARLDAGVRVDAADLEGIVEFLRVFADKCHHGKEEGLLFPALVEAGMPGDAGPIAVMLAEHEEGRALIGGLAVAVRRCAEGEAGASAGIVENACGYVDLLRAHIQKENNVLFPLADQMLGAEVDARLEAAFEELEERKIGAGRHEEFHRLLERLEKTYLRETAPSRAT